MPNYITHTASYIPEHVITNDDLSQNIDTSDEWIVSRTGIKQRCIAKDYNTSYMAIQAKINDLNKKSPWLSRLQIHLPIHN